MIPFLLQIHQRPNASATPAALHRPLRAVREPKRLDHAARQRLLRPEPVFDAPAAELPLHARAMQSRSELINKPVPAQIYQIFRKLAENVADRDVSVVPAVGAVARPAGQPVLDEQNAAPEAVFGQSAFDAAARQPGHAVDDDGPTDGRPEPRHHLGRPEHQHRVAAGRLRLQRGRGHQARAHHGGQPRLQLQQRPPGRQPAAGRARHFRSNRRSACLLGLRHDAELGSLTQTLRYVQPK